MQKEWVTHADEEYWKTGQKWNHSVILVHPQKANRDFFQELSPDHRYGGTRNNANAACAIVMDPWQLKNRLDDRGNPVSTQLPWVEPASDYTITGRWIKDLDVGGKKKPVFQYWKPSYEVTLESVRGEELEGRKSLRFTPMKDGDGKPRAEDFGLPEF
jgi:hypothetical protein